MGTEVDVFISNYTLVDPEIYQLYIEGHSAAEATSILNQRGLANSTGASIELIASDVLDHYRTYFLLEKLLSDPNKLQEQLAFQIEPQTRQLLIERYYDFDDVVVREFIGKKLTSKLKKDLDEISDKTGIPLKACRRQFDNVKRVFKVVEDMPGPIVQNIQNCFYLPEEIAKKYACVVLLYVMRFETSKRKLKDINFDTWRKCADCIMENWISAGGEYDPDREKELLTDLKETKVLQGEKERELKQLVCTALKQSLLQKHYLETDTTFRTYSRGILNVASSIFRPKEMKNFFLEISNLSDMFRQGNWNSHDIEDFLIVYKESAAEIDTIKESANVRIVWEKFMKVTTVCVTAFYVS